MLKIKIFLFLIIFTLNLNAITLKQYLLQYCNNNHLTLIYDVDINPQIFPSNNFNFIDLSHFYNISFLRKKHFLIVTRAIPRLYIFKINPVSDDVLKSIFSFLDKNQIPYQYSYFSFRVFSTPYLYSNLLLPFFNSYIIYSSPIAVRTKQ